MKRAIIALILVLSVLVCLPACGQTSAGQDIYTQLNGFSNTANSYTIQICVTSPAGNKVTETYAVTVAGTTQTVDYRIEEINPITVDGNSITVPESYVTVTEGTLHATADSQSPYAVPSFKFSDSVLKNFTAAASGYPRSFSADVVNAKDFMGRELNGSDITISGSFTASSFEEIVVAYKTASGNTVTVTYSFN